MRSAITLCIFGLLLAGMAAAQPIELCQNNLPGQSFSITETGSEIANFTCTGFTFGGITGHVPQWTDPNGSLSDFLTITEHAGIVFFTLFSDPLLQFCAQSCLFPAIAEPGTFTAVGTSPTGQRIRVSFFSDANENTINSDLATFNGAVPEPASLVLLGSGLLALGCLSRKRTSRRPPRRPLTVI